jgi:hypothetical protein
VASSTQLKTPATVGLETGGRRSSKGGLTQPSKPCLRASRASRAPTASGLFKASNTSCPASSNMTRGTTLAAGACCKGKECEGSQGCLLVAAQGRPVCIPAAFAAGPGGFPAACTAKDCKGCNPQAAMPAAPFVAHSAALVCVVAARLPDSRHPGSINVMRACQPQCAALRPQLVPDWTHVLQPGTWDNPGEQGVQAVHQSPGNACLLQAAPH